MNISLSSVNPFLLPTGEPKPLVCLGDLPLSDYQLPSNTITEQVTHFLEAHPDLPGVILLNEAGQLHGAMTRSRIFEQLGHMYGVELFLRKPIHVLYQNQTSNLYSIPSNTRIQDAVQFALNRPVADVYDPLVVVFEDSSVRLLDMKMLLLAQSQVLENARTIVRSLTQIEQALAEDAPVDRVIDMSVKSLVKTVPNHRVAIHVYNMAAVPFKHPILHPVNAVSHPNQILDSILTLRQPVNIDDVALVPAWEPTPPFAGIRSWIGLPLFNALGSFGVLSLMRNCQLPFTQEELSMTGAFAELLGRAFYPDQQRMNERRALPEFIEKQKNLML